MQQILTDDELGHALFYAIKLDDFEHALFLLSLQAPVKTSHFVGEEKLVYTISLLVGKVAFTLKTYGLSHARTQLALRVLDCFIDRKSDLRCHCTPKQKHFCPMSAALKHVRLDSEDDLMSEDKQLIINLLFHGATYKNLTGERSYVWKGLDQLLSYIHNKKEDAVNLVRTNRHQRCVAV